MRFPEIKSCDNGVLEWASYGATAYILTVDGVPVSDSEDGTYRGTAFDASGLVSDARISVTPCRGTLRGKPLVVIYRVSDGKFVAPPVTGFKLDGEVLSWDPVGDGVRYRIVDVDFNVTYTAKCSFDMTKRNIVVSVCPDLGCGSFDFCDIPYLEGDGTEAAPYEIRTPFDLRTVDYYEMSSAQRGVVNCYKIMNDLDYNDVGALDCDSNMFTLRKPFCGRLDGNGKKLYNINVIYDGGYWAMFDFLAAGSVVENIVFSSPRISNRLQSPHSPISATVATVADVNYGTVRGITVKDAVYTAAGGEICGIATHNYGLVKACSVSGTFVQEGTGQPAQACYEAAGVVLENCRGGAVEGCEVVRLGVRGTECVGYDGSTYFNVRTVGGVVSVNRAGATVSACRCDALTLTNMLNNRNGFAGGFEWGGTVAYNAGIVEECDGQCNMTFNGNAVTKLIGADGEPTDDQCGTLIGKNDGKAADAP